MPHNNSLLRKRLPDLLTISARPQQALNFPDRVCHRIELRCDTMDVLPCSRDHNIGKADCMDYECWHGRTRPLFSSTTGHLGFLK